MTADYPKVSPRNIRVIVHIADLDGQAVADVPVKQLSAWLDSLDTLTSSPMMKWTGGGAMVAAEIFRVALEAGEHMVVCLAATWISLYGTGLPPRLRADAGRFTGGGWRQAHDRRHQRPAVLGIPAGEPRRESGRIQDRPRLGFRYCRQRMTDLDGTILARTDWQGRGWRLE